MKERYPDQLENFMKDLKKASLLSKATIQSQKGKWNHKVLVVGPLGWSALCKYHFLIKNGYDNARFELPSMAVPCKNVCGFLRLDKIPYSKLRWIKLLNDLSDTSHCHVKSLVLLRPIKEIYNVEYKKPLWCRFPCMLEGHSELMHPTRNSAKANPFRIVTFFLGAVWGRIGLQW